MARFTIYSKDGQIKRHEGEPQYSGSYMGVDFVEFRTISSPAPIDWQIGDYVDYYRTGKRYRLYSLPMPKKVARKGEYGASFEYSNVQLYGATKELEIAPFRDLVPKDNKIHFSTRPDVSTYENVYGIARRIQECMDDLYPNKWRIEVYDTDDTDLLSLFEETKEYSVSGGSCLDALSQIYETWKNVGWIHTYDSANKVDVITIGRANVRNADNTSDSFAYGVGKGLTSIKKASANKDEFATRLYIYGSERNIQTRYYNGLDILNKDSVDIRNLMLPIEKWGKTNGLPDASKAYLQADDSIIEKYGLIPRTVYFDGSQNEEIYPSIVGLTERRVRQAMINAGQSSSPNLPPDRDVRLDVVASVDFTKDSGDKTAVESNPTFKLYYGHLGFNLADQGRLTSEGYAVISMKSGACAGREFVVQSSEDTGDGYGLQFQIAVVKRTWDESLGMGFPNEIYPIKNGDKFVILDIPMPDYYITLAAGDLLSAGEKMLADYTRVSAFYEPSVDAIKIKEGGKLLQAGMFMQVYDEDIIDTADKKDYVLIDTLTIDEKSDLPIYRVTLREQKRSARTYSALEDMIEDARETNKREINRVKQYTDRRFRSAQETLDMLQGAFENFSDGIDPVTIKTMATLVGDESLQYKFTSASNSLTDIACPLYYDETTKQMKSSSAYLKHMTLGIKEITTGALSASSYLTWRLPAWSSAILEDAEQSYYVYIKAAKNGDASECLLSKTAIGMESVSGYYHFLVGILNSEHSGSRDFVTLYGFTEVLPGQITTDVLRSGNGKLIIDLARAIITANEGAVIEGDIHIGKASTGLENLAEWQEKQQQINKAQSDAESASQRLNEWASDGIISPVEKQALKNELAVVNSDYDDIHKQYEKYIQEFDAFILTDGKYYVTEDGYIFNVEVADSNWLSFRSAYQSYVAELTLKTSTSESVEVGDLTNKQNAYYSARTAMLEDISLSIKAEADYSKKRANQAIQDASDARGIADTANASVTTLGTRIDGVDKTIAEINNKLDGVVESYFDDYIPSRDNLPASEWIANGTEADHIGDTFTNTALNGEGAGQSWRWLEQADGSYDWQQIADSDAAKALTLAGQAKAAADGKTKTFLVTPTNYNVGDIWIVGDTVPEAFAFKKGDILTTSSDSVSYVANHWSKVINYNDEFQSTLDAKVGELNTAINNVEQSANDYTDDARITLQNSINALNEAKANLKDVYTTTQADGKISEYEQRAIDAANKYAEEAVNASKTEIEAWADGEIKQAEQDAIDAANASLQQAKNELDEALRDLESEVDGVRTLANNAQAIASSATSKLNEWASDNVISPLEKEGLRTELAFILGDYNDIEKNYIKYIQEFDTLILQDGKQYVTVDGFVFNVEVANTNWQAYKSAYDAYKGDLESKTANNDTVEIGNLKTTQSAYYNKRALILEDITLAIKAEADYATEQSRAAKKEAEEAKKEIADYDYLRGALGDAKSLAVEGVVMSQMVAVAEAEEAESVTKSYVAAFLNGSDVARDDEHGKMILAGGIPNDGRDLDVRAKEAKTRIYENGRVDTNDIHATGGTFENVTVSGIFKNPFNDDGTFVSKSDNYVNLKSSSTRAISLPTDIEQSGRKVTFVGYFIITCGTDIIVEGKETDFYEISNEITELVAVKVSASQVQWHVLRRMPYGLNECSTVRHSGMFAGLRPKTRVITSTSSAQDRQLTELDHTIIVNAEGYRIDLTLPDSPQEGQRYDIYVCHPTTDLYISTGGINVYDFIYGGDNATGTLQFTSDRRLHIELFFCGQWWLNYRFLN